MHVANRRSCGPTRAAALGVDGQAVLAIHQHFVLSNLTLARIVTVGLRMQGFRFLYRRGSREFLRQRFPLPDPVDTSLTGGGQWSSNCYAKSQWSIKWHLVSC